MASAKVAGPRRPRGGLLLGIAASLLAHGALLGGAWAFGALWPKASSQHVMVTKLVRLGPSKHEQLLPERAETLPEPPSPTPPVPAAAPEPPPPPAPQPASPAPAAPRAARRPPAPAHSPRATRAALARLKQRNHGSQAGAPDGDADEAELGEAYAAELYRCVKSNYVIEGIEATRVSGLKAVVLVHVQADGRIARHRVTSSSGLAAFDRAVSRAVARCGHISPPPSSLAANLRREGLEIEFVP